MWFRSLRVRIPLLAGLVLAVSLAVVTLLAVSFIYQFGQRDLDRALEREQQRFGQAVASLVAESLAEQPDQLPSEAVDPAVRRYLELNPPSESYAVVIELATGRRLSSTVSTPLLQPFTLSENLPEVPEGRIATIDTPVGDARAVSIPVDLGGERVAVMRLYAPLQPVADQARATAAFMAAAAAISLVIGAILLVGLLGRSLRPLRQLSQSARATDLDEFTARVDVPDTGDEVAVLATEFNSMLSRLEDALDRQQWLFASISHELRTPVTIARGHLELLEASLDDDHVRTTTAILRDELQRLGAMVEDLLTIARVDTDEFVRLRSVDLVAWFEELALKLTGHPASGTLVLDPPPPLTFQADPERLTQAVINLISNAYRHNPPGTSVRVAAQVDGDWLSVEVTDNGNGIPDHIRPRMFEPFVRASDAEGSTGLGLSVVHAVVEAHGGAVTVDTSDSGTCVRLGVPLLPTSD